MSSEGRFINQSEVIAAMRFPLIVLVVIGHSLGFESKHVSFLDYSGWGLYHFVSEIISHNFAFFTVCWFFVFSGYYFFFKLEEGSFSIKWVLNQWKKRIKTLLIPYVIWNLILVLAIALKSVVLSATAWGNDGGIDYLKETGPVLWFITGPLDFPLWFLRNLIIMTIAAPLLYLFIKRFKWISLALLTVLYISPIDLAIPSIISIYYFFIGCWLGIWKTDMLELAHKIRIPAAIGCAITLLVATYFNDSPRHEWILRFFYPFGMLTFMNLCRWMTQNHNIKERLIILSKSVFFIYAAHEVFILGWTKGLFLRVFGDGLAGLWISYWGVPIVVLLVCLGLYLLLNRTMPRALAFACGGRANKTTEK